MTEIQSQIKELVERMIELHGNLTECKIPEEKNKLKQQIAALDKQIASKVNKLYDLSEEDIETVKNLTQ